MTTDQPVRSKKFLLVVVDILLNIFILLWWNISQVVIKNTTQRMQGIKGWEKNNVTNKANHQELKLNWSLIMHSIALGDSFIWDDLQQSEACSTPLQLRAWPLLWNLTQATETLSAMLTGPCDQEFTEKQVSALLTTAKGLTSGNLFREAFLTSTVYARALKMWPPKPSLLKSQQGVQTHTALSVHKAIYLNKCSLHSYRMKLGTP